jgi:hypothetical protein
LGSVSAFLTPAARSFICQVKQNGHMHRTVYQYIHTVTVATHTTKTQNSNEVMRHRGSSGSSTTRDENVWWCILYRVMLYNDYAAVFLHLPSVRRLVSPRDPAALNQSYDVRLIDGCIKFYLTDS